MENEEPDLAGAFGASVPVETAVEVPPVETPAAPQETPEQRQSREDNFVPRGVMHEERRRRQDAERELTELRRQFQQQPKPEQPKVDYYENPQEAIRQEAQQITSQATDPIRAALMFNSRLVAQQVHGKEAAEAAEQAFNEALANGELDPTTASRINASPNPFHAAVEWHRQQQVLKTVGNDLSAYETKLLDEKLKDPEFLARAVAAHQTAQQARQPNGQFGAKPTNVSRLPPSLSRMTGSANAPSGDVSDEDMARAFGG